MIDGNSSAEEVDSYILSKVSANSPATPKEIAEDRLRESFVRIRCRRLASGNLLKEKSHDLFVLTNQGIEFISEDRDLDERDIQLPSSKESGITDFSDIDPEDIKWRNKRYFTNPDHRYNQAHHSSQAILHRIENVRNGDIQRIMDEFPTRESLAKQCAHWVRSIVGLHFFPDANHRTAMATLNALLQLNGLERISWQNRKYRSVIFKSKILRRFVLNVRFDNLWARDELYRLWHRYFATQLYQIPDYNHHDPSFDYLDSLLDQNKQ